MLHTVTSAAESRSTLQKPRWVRGLNLSKKVNVSRSTIYRMESTNWTLSMYSSGVKLDGRRFDEDAVCEVLAKHCEVQKTHVR